MGNICPYSEPKSFI